MSQSPKKGNGGRKFLLKSDFHSLLDPKLFSSHVFHIPQIFLTPTHNKKKQSPLSLPQILSIIIFFILSIACKHAWRYQAEYDYFVTLLETMIIKTALLTCIPKEPTRTLSISEINKHINALIVKATTALKTFKRSVQRRNPQVEKFSWGLKDLLSALHGIYGECTIETDGDTIHVDPPVGRGSYVLSM